MARLRNRGQIPSDLGWLVDLLDDFEDRLRDLEAPSGTMRYGTTEKLQEAQATLATTVAELADLVNALEDRLDLYLSTQAPALIAAEVSSQIAAVFAAIPGTDLTSTSGRFVVWSGPDGTLGHT